VSNKAHGQLYFYDHSMTHLSVSKDLPEMYYSNITVAYKRNLLSLMKASTTRFLQQVCKKFLGTEILWGHHFHCL